MSVPTKDRGARLSPAEVRCVYNTLCEHAEFVGLNDEQDALLGRLSGYVAAGGTPTEGGAG